jgi:hypothetical protein
MIHGYFTLGKCFPEARAGVLRAARALREHLQVLGRAPGVE